MYAGAKQAAGTPVPLPSQPASKPGREGEETTEPRARPPAVAPELATPDIHHNHVEDPHSATRETGQDLAQVQVHDTEGKGSKKAETALPEQHPVSAQSRHMPGQGPQPQQHQDESMNRIHPYTHLIRGYFRQQRAGESSSWQPRRSLDAYFYHHLPSTTHRDRDQVVLRYTTSHQLPVRIFMVDQLWMWILGNRECAAAPFLRALLMTCSLGTIITCSALNHDSWIWEAQGKAGKSGNRKGKWALAREDRMNAHQKVLRHLKSPRGSPSPQFMI
jgi:hypothetical protein